jgi:regulator of vacuolar morphogenesis
MREQDLDVQDLTAIVRRMKDMGIAINEELVDQGQLLDVLDQDVDRVGAKIDVAKKRIRKIN